MEDFLDVLIAAANARQIEASHVGTIDMFHEALRKNFDQIIEFLKHQGMNEADAYELMSLTCQHQATMAKGYANYLRDYEREHPVAPPSQPASR